MILSDVIKFLEKKIQYAENADSDVEHIRMSIEMAKDIKTFLDDYYEFLKTEEEYEDEDDELYVDEEDLEDEEDEDDEVEECDLRSCECEGKLKLGSKEDSLRKMARIVLYKKELSMLLANTSKTREDWETISGLANKIAEECEEE